MAQVRQKIFSNGCDECRLFFFFVLFRFSVLDEDAVGADFLGEYRLKLSLIRADIKELFSIYLQPKVEVRRNKTDLS